MSLLTKNTLEIRQKIVTQRTQEDTSGNQQSWPNFTIGLINCIQRSASLRRAEESVCPGQLEQTTHGETRLLGYFLVSTCPGMTSSGGYDDQRVVRDRKLRSGMTNKTNGSPVLQDLAQLAEGLCIQAVGR